MYDICDDCDKTCHNCMLQKPRQIEVSEGLYICWDCLNENASLRESYIEYNNTKQEKELEMCHIHGCTNMYRPTVPGQSWCRTCAWKVKKGICPSCNRRSEQLSSSGMCPACETNHFAERYAIVDTNAYVKRKCACGSVETKVEGIVCEIEECLTAHKAHICRHCWEVKIPESLDICHNCFKKIYDETTNHS